MNINQLIKRIKNELGLSRYLELSYTDQDIYNIIVDHTLPEWGRLFRYEIEFMNCQFNHANKVGPDLYELPKDVTDLVSRSGLEIIALKEARFGYYGINSGFGSFVSNYEMDLSLPDLYASAYNTYRYGHSDLNTQSLFRGFFEKPNKIRFVFPDTYMEGIICQLSFYLSLSPNLHAISPTREHDFFELAKLNTMIVLYNNEAKYIENISSGLGNIDLKISDWADAASRKQEFLKELMEYSQIHEAPNMIG